MLTLKNVTPVDPVLTQFAIEYRNTEFIGDQIFPRVPVAYETGTYYTFTSKESFNLVPTLRAPGSLYKRLTLSASSSTYQTQEDGAEVPVDDRIRATAVEPLDVLRRSTEKVTDAVLLRREKIIIDAITNATTFASYTTAVAAADRWDDVNSEPIYWVDYYSNLVRASCGHIPNVMVIPWNVWLAIKEHPVIKDIIKVTNDKIVTVDLLARVFNIDRILISKALYNSAEEGQTVSLSTLMGKSVFLGWVNPSPALDAPSVGYLLQKENIMIDRYREEQTRAEIVRARVNEVPKIVAADCGYLLTTVIS